MKTKEQYYYSYNLANNEFEGKYLALKNPRRPKEYLLPAKATFESPPKTKENEIAIWTGSAWEIEMDLRGKLQVSLETKEVLTISDIGKVKSGFQQIDEKTAEKIKENPEIFDVRDGTLIDVSNTKEYIYRQETKQKEIIKTELEHQLEDLDRKRIRAICEPENKNETTGETWLDYYNAKIKSLREEINGLK